MFNLFLVFMISGIWHGANWTYVIWGSLHGLYLIIGILKDDFLTARKWKPVAGLSWLYKSMNVLITFHLALFAWIFFRANNVEEAFNVVHKIFNIDWTAPAFAKSLVFLVSNPNYVGRIVFHLLLLFIFIFCDPLFDKIVKNKLTIPSTTLKMFLYAIILAAIVLFGYFGEVQFIYFQF